MPIGQETWYVQSGAFIPDADVIVSEMATNISYSTEKDSKGLYTIPYLAAVNYTITITKEGFQKSTINELHLNSAQTVKQYVKPTVGAANVQVKVNASAQHLNTEGGTLAGITPAEIIDVIPTSPTIGSNNCRVVPRRQLRYLD